MQSVPIAMKNAYNLSPEILEKFQKIRLVAFDLDGTLLDDEKRLGAAAIEAVKELRRRGVQATLMTGRTYAGTVEFAEALGIDLPLAVMNGAMLRDRFGKIVRQAALEPAHLAELVEMVGHNGAAPFVFTPDEILMPERSRDCMIYLNFWGIMRNYRVVDDLRTVEDPVLQLHLIAHEKRLIELSAQFEKRFPEAFELFRFPSLKLEKHHLEVREVGLNKKTGMELLLKTLNLEWDQVMTFGDWLNDLEVLAASGLSAAPANAEQPVKETVDIVLEEDNNQDGIGRFLSGVLQTLEIG